jgi:hypothetical protein
MSIGSVNINKLKNNIRKNDSITIKITEEDYLNRIKGTVKLTYAEKYSAYSEIDIVELKSNNEYYLTIDNYNRINNENRKWGVGSTLVFGILFLVCGIIYRRKIKPATNMGLVSS